MHNYPFNTGYSLTDINELSETTHTDTHIQAHTHKSNWTEGKNEQPFCHLVNTNCIDLQFYLKSTQTTTIAKWHGFWGCEWYLSVPHSLQVFKTVSSVGPWDKTQNQILQSLLNWNGQEARGDSYNTISKQSSFFKDEFKPIPQNTVWHQGSEETKENIPYLSPLKHHSNVLKLPLLLWLSGDPQVVKPQKGCFSDSCSCAAAIFTGLAVLQSWKQDFCHLDCQLQSYKRFRFTGWTKFYLKLFRTKHKQFDSKITL